MDVNEKILQRLDELLVELEDVEKQHSGRGDSKVPYNPWISWRVSALTLVGELTGKDSQYYRDFVRLADSRDKEHVAAARSVLKRIRDDYAKGYLRDIRRLAAAEVFTDFLDMAEHLHSQGYGIPAATITGAVLEDSLRRLHLKQIGHWQGDSSISKLNDGLRKANVYDQAVWRQIQAWGDIRNDADHGHFDKVDSDAVKRMVSGIRDFVAKHEG